MHDPWKCLTCRSTTCPICKREWIKDVLSDGDECYHCRKPSVPVTGS